MGLGPDPEDRSLSLTPLRVITILGLVTVQVALACVWQLVTMVRRGTVFSHAAFRYMDVMIGAIVAAALVWFAVNLMPIAIDVDVMLAGRKMSVGELAEGRAGRVAPTRGARGRTVSCRRRIGNLMSNRGPTAGVGATPPGLNRQLRRGRRQTP